MKQRRKIAAFEAALGAAVRDMRRVGHVGRRHQVARPDFDGGQPEVPSGHVEQGFEGEGRFGLSGAAIGRQRRLVGADADDLQRHVRNLVRAGAVAGCDHGRDDAAGKGIGADVDRKPALHRQNAPVAIVADFQVGLGCARMGRRLEMLEAVLDPFHRPAEHPAGVADDDFLDIGPGLGAEAAADILGDHAHAVFRQVQDRGQVLAHGIVRLGRDMQGQRGPAGVEVGDAAARLERYGGLPREREPPRNPAGTPAQCRPGVAGLVHERRCDIARPGSVQRRRALGQRGRSGSDDGQRPVIDRDQRRQVLGLVAAAGHHEGDRLTDETDAAPRQKGHHGGPQVRMAVARYQRLFDEGQIVGRQHQRRPGRARFSGLDAGDFSMGDRAAHEDGVRHAVERPVVDEPRPARQQAGVLDAAIAGSGAFSRHIRWASFSHADRAFSSMGVLSRHERRRISARTLCDWNDAGKPTGMGALRKIDGGAHPFPSFRPERRSRGAEKSFTPGATANAPCRKDFSTSRFSEPLRSK